MVKTKIPLYKNHIAGFINKTESKAKAQLFVFSLAPFASPDELQS